MNLMQFYNVTTVQMLLMNHLDGFDEMVIIFSLLDSHLFGPGSDLIRSENFCVNRFYSVICYEGAIYALSLYYILLNGP